MVDHTTLLFVLGVAVGTSLHAAVTHYKVPVLMAARAAVATAKKAAVEAFEDVSDEEVLDEDSADSGSQDATRPECRGEQASLQLCPLAIVTTSPAAQLMRIQPSAPKLPIVQPTVLRRIQHWVAAGPPALRLEGRAAWHNLGRTPVLDHFHGRSAGRSSNARRRAAWAGGKLGSGVTAFKLRVSWGGARVSSAAFVAAAVIGVSCVWWAWDCEPAQQHDSNNKTISGSSSSSRLFDTSAVLKMVRGSQEPPSINPRSKSTGTVSPEHGYAFYLPHGAASLSLGTGLLQQPPMPQAGPVHSPSSSPDSSGLTNAAATHQQKMVQQQNLGVSLHQQTKRDRELSVLDEALQSTRPGHHNSDSRSYLTAWFHLMDEYLSEEVQLAEALVGQ